MPATTKRGDLEEGDHIYSWHTSFGISYQHHGIVTRKNKDEDIQICDFNCTSNENTLFASSLASTTLDIASTGNSILREMELSEWIILHGEPMAVSYGTKFWKRMFQWPGTCTAAQRDPRGLVAARARFLLDRPELVAKYHLLESNCESFAVWCTTGTYATLQGLALLSLLNATAIGGACGFGSLATTTSAATVPASGIWGYLGYEMVVLTRVPLLLANPLLVGAASVATITPALITLYKCKHEWKKTTNCLNEHFWSMADPDAILPCIVHWSGLLP